MLLVTDAHTAKGAIALGMVDNNILAGWLSWKVGEKTVMIWILI